MRSTQGIHPKNKTDFFTFISYLPIIQINAYYVHSKKYKTQQRSETNIFIDSHIQEGSLLLEPI